MASGASATKDALSSVMRSASPSSPPASAGMDDTLLPGAVGDGDPEYEEVEIDEKDLYQRPPPAPPEWIELILTALNEKRSKHWTPPLVWSEMCYEYAKRQADTCAQKGKIKFGLTDTVQGRLGQCILGPKDGGPWKMQRKGVAEKIANVWYAERKEYDLDKPAHHEKSANFEQMMWFGSTSVGVAMSKDARFCVANFYPAGPDAQNGPPGNKGRNLYFPPGHDVPEMSKKDKSRAWFKTNVLPPRDGPCPWVGGVERRPASPVEDDKRSPSPGSPGGRDMSPDGSGKTAGKKGKPSSRGNSRGRKSIAGDTLKKEDMKLMKPNSAASKRSDKSNRTSSPPPKSPGATSKGDTTRSSAKNRAKSPKGRSVAAA